MPQEEDEAMFRRNLSLTRRRSLRNGGDKDDKVCTLLHIGAKKGDLKQVKQLLDEGMNVNVVTFGPKSKGIAPLHLAAEGGHVDIMDELLDRGADIDARTRGACGSKARKREAVKFLIENGACLPEDINDSRFNPPLHYCPGLEWAYEEMKQLQLDSSSVGKRVIEQTLNKTAPEDSQVAEYLFHKGLFDSTGIAASGAVV